MYKILSSFIVIAMTATWVSVVYATDISRGQMLYENHCGVCHKSMVHVREKRMSKSIGDISHQVGRWQSELKLGWDKSEIDDVVQYLNGRFYQY